ncbi:MAG: DUF4832 domain-containing protein [Oscillospiraceae bacterium]|nr:DUF4832 domain-containing protein [Oscillospiraceae bacterium]
MKRTHLKQTAAALLAVLTGVSGGMIPQMRLDACAAARTDSGIDCTECTDTVLNPGMGYTTTLWYRCAPGKTAVQNPAGSLVLMFIDIGAFSSGENGTKHDDGTYTPGTDYPLDDTFFAGLRGTFENCRQNGSTIAVRFRYDDDGTRDPEPATFDMLKSHIRQIADSHLLDDYADILMYVESGFVGCYGEQWGGKYCSLEQKAELLDLMLDVVPDPVPVTVRTPNIFAKWAGIEQKDLAEWTSEAGSRAARVGMYDDGYMGSDSDLGTYSNRANETAWLGRQAVTAYFGGEFSGNLEYAQQFDTYLPENAVPEMYKTHLSYINSNIFGLYNDYTFGSKYDVPNADNSAYYGQTVRKFIRDHLGYRFVLRKSEMNETAAQGGLLDLHFAVENTGFVNPIRQQRAELLLERNGDYMRTDLDLDSRTWYSCTTSDIEQQIRLPGGIEPGEWKVYLKLSVGDNTISQMHQRSVRFANNGIWNAGLGANYLGKVNVQASANAADRARDQFGKNGNGTLYTVNSLQLTDGVESNRSELSAERLAAESASGKLYLYNDEQYLYLTAVYDAVGDAEVHNIHFKNTANDTSYWLYYASNGFIYFNHGTPDGCLQKHTQGLVEFRIPFGAVMGLEQDIKLENVRYFMQDSDNEWAVLSDVTAKEYTLTGDFPVYTAKRGIELETGGGTVLSVLDGAAEPAKYQWYHDGKAISGATGSSYRIADAKRSTAGTYSVQITSAAGTVKTAEICDVKMSDVQAKKGDVNADGRTDSADAALLLQYLLTKTKTLPSPDNADIDGNGILNAADLSALKRLTA